MRGHRHPLRLIGLRRTTGADAGEPVRDAEGRYQRSPTNPPTDVSVREVIGFIGFPRRAEEVDGVTVDNAAHLPLGTVVLRGDEVEAHDTGDTNLDGRYRIMGVQVGRALIRLQLKRTDP